MTSFKNYTFILTEIYKFVIEDVTIVKLNKDKIFNFNQINWDEIATSNVAMIGYYKIPKCQSSFGLPSDFTESENKKRIFVSNEIEKESYQDILFIIYIYIYKG